MDRRFRGSVFALIAGLLLAPRCLFADDPAGKPDGGSAPATTARAQPSAGEKTERTKGDGSHCF